MTTTSRPAGGCHCRIYGESAVLLATSSNWDGMVWMSCVWSCMSKCYCNNVFIRSANPDYSHGFAPQFSFHKWIKPVQSNCADIIVKNICSVWQIDGRDVVSYYHNRNQWEWKLITPIIPSVDSTGVGIQCFFVFSRVRTEGAFWLHGNNYPDD